MVRSTSVTNSPNWERRSRNLGREIERILWERLIQSLPENSPKDLSDGSKTAKPGPG